MQFLTRPASTAPDRDDLAARAEAAARITDAWLDGTMPAPWLG